MTVTTDGIIAACSGLLVVFAVVGIAVRLILLPYLRDHLVQPVAEVREQVKNTHETNLREDVDAIASQVAALAQSFERSRIVTEQWQREHMTYSASIADRVERVEKALRAG